MTFRALILATAMTVAATLSASAQTLSVGDDAPAIEVSDWVKGEKIPQIDKERTYVVEFWATWCGPCRTSIPHLTELQKTYKDKDVRFIGVSVFEQDQKKVKPFVESMGDKMEYSVAIDDVPQGEKSNKGKMALSWMIASNSNGIPTAFIVRGGKVAWIGHPMEMDKPLAKITSGTFDLAKAASEFREEKAKEERQQAAMAKIRKLGRNPSDKDLLAVINEVIADNADTEQAIGLQKYHLMVKLGDSDASTYGEKLVTGLFHDEPQVLNDIAWTNIDPDGTVEDSKRDVKLALKAARRADELTNHENGPILDTLALAYFKSGESAKALEAQEKAIKLMGDGDEAMKERLETYRKATAKKP